MSYNVLIIDDDIELCELLRKYLELENYAVEISHEGEEGLKKALLEEYHLIVLDIMIPKMNGFEVLSAIRKESNVPVLMLTAKDSEVDKVSGLRLGADDYLTKPFSISEFTARAASLIRRYTAFNSFSQGKKEERLMFSNLEVDIAAREVLVNGVKADLTAKEFDLLAFLAKNKGKVFTKKQIYKSVWEDEYAFDDNNIMVHIRRLRKKIELNPEEPVFIQTVWGVGYKFGGEERA